MASTVTISKGLVGKEDINFEDANTTPSTFTRTSSGASTQSITKLAAAHLKIEDANSRITATDVEGALQEVALSSSKLGDVFDDAKGADIASAATIVIPSGHLLFDVTGTTDISAITIDTGGVAGRLIILQFDGITTVSMSSTLRLNGDFPTLAGNILTLIYDGTNWREVSRQGGSAVAWTGPNPSSTAASTSALHSGPFTSVDNVDLGQVVTTDDDEYYSLGNPLNGFIGGQNSRSF